MTIHKVLVFKLQWFYGKSHIELITTIYKKIIELETFFRFLKGKFRYMIPNTQFTVLSRLKFSLTRQKSYIVVIDFLATNISGINSNTYV